MWVLIQISGHWVTFSGKIIDKQDYSIHRMVCRHAVPHSSDPEKNNAHGMERDSIMSLL